MKNKYITIGALAISLLYIDLFCGAGGTSTGVEAAMVGNEKCAKVVACVNHDPNAIASHAKNHPESKHFTEDMRILDLAPAIMHVNEMRKLYPFAKVVLWASLECTNHSKAKGGMSRDADSRTLADHLFRYIEAFKPDSLQIENVEEFLIWGPLIEKVVHRDGTSYCPLTPLMQPIWVPDPERKGEYYNEWVKKVKKYGYMYDFKLLNCADFGAFTSRKRLFIQFNTQEFPIVWPEPTHAKNPEKNLFENLEKWKPVKDVLHLDDEGKSIFGRKKPLVEPSLERIYQGLIKFVADGEDKWLLKYNSTSKKGKHIPPGINDPCPTIATQGRLGLMSASFLSAYYGKGYVTSLGSPSPTLTTKDRFSLINTCFIYNQYGNSSVSDINNPSGTITTTPKQNLVTAKSKIHYIMDSQYSRVGNSVDQPCFTLIARMDKTPPYLIEITSDGDIPSFIKIVGDTVIYEIYEDDSPMTKKIKEFMAHYGLIDIKMRMLKIQELKEITGFPKDYVLIGTQADQKKFIGNAVPPLIARKICEASALRLFEDRKAA